jgi:hypothetical protein
MTKAGKRVANFHQGASVLITGRGHPLYSIYWPAYLVFTKTISQSNVSVGSASNTRMSLAACLSSSVPYWVRCALLGFIVSCILSYPMQVSGVTATSPAHPRSHIPIHPADATPEVKVNVKDTVDSKVRTQTYAGSWPLDSMTAELQVTVD